MSKAVPKLLRRFRARELERLCRKGETRRNCQGLGGTPIYLQDVNANHVPSYLTLHNPFLPRPLFDPKTRANADSDESANREVKKTGQKLRKGEKNLTENKERKKWAQPHYSLRRQAVLVKQARASGTLHLLPPGPKLSVEELESAKLEAKRREEEEQTMLQEEAPQKVDEQKVRPSKRAVKRSIAALGHPHVIFRWTGKAPTNARKRLTIYTGRRRMFKGHKWERNLEKRRAQIAVRMRDMPKRITRFKNVYRRRRPDPLKPTAPRKKEPLPF